mmetsp:Transcript_19906/g.30330  ORF Transcript_19906/g.30330 Transcript_19906/m.30330 type:complete len:148 (+) Transcript_19906:112-555(+)
MSSTRTVSVRFADTALLYIVNRQQDYDKKNDVARNELWYTAADFHSMRQAVAQDVFHVRAQALAGVPFNYAGDDESSVCCVGIENFLTAGFMVEMSACRERCTDAVLVEQAREDHHSARAIAIASFAQTKKVVRRATMLGKVHQDSI